MRWTNEATACCVAKMLTMFQETNSQSDARPPITPEIGILSTTRCWRATPWDYSSIIALTFRAEGKGEMTYAYGQTVYQVVPFCFSIPSPGRLRLAYERSPRYEAFEGYVRTLETPPRDFEFSLTKEEFSGVEANVGPFTYLWKLALSASPFPEQPRLPCPELQLPPPLTYYGHRATISSFTKLWRFLRRLRHR